MTAPTELRVSKDRRLLTVTFPAHRPFELPAEMLRVLPPSAEVQGQSPAQRVNVSACVEEQGEAAQMRGAAFEHRPGQSAALSFSGIKLAATRCRVIPVTRASSNRSSPWNSGPHPVTSSHNPSGGSSATSGANR